MGKECIIETTHEERDLGVIITETLDLTKQCVRAANRACKSRARKRGWGQEVHILHVNI